MNIFNTPDWDSSQIGNENAMQLFTTNVKIKISRKSKVKNNVDNGKTNLKTYKTVNPKGKSISTVTNKSEGKEFINKNCISNSLNVDNPQSTLRNKNRSKKNLSIPDVEKQRQTENTKSDNTKKYLFDEQAIKKLTKQKIQRLKKKNKLNKNSDVILNNKPSQNNQEKVIYRSISTVTNKSEGKEFINKNGISNILKVDNPQSTLRNKSRSKKNLSIPDVEKHRQTENTKSDTTKKYLLDEQVIKKLTKQKIRRLKKKNKLNKNSDVIVNDKPSQNNQKKVKLKKTVNSLMDTNLDNSATLIGKKTKLISLLTTKVITKKKKPVSLKDRMIEKLKASRFRYINEQIYNSESKEAQKYFKKDPHAFYAYHEGYMQQVSKWPLNPIDVIIKSIRKMPTDFLIADFGCGEAKLAKSVPQKVYSYDLVAVNEFVTACDMSKVPLENEKVNVVVFCLSLMGTNIRDYLFEANRVLKNGGMLKIAEVESRFDTVDTFIDGVKRFGFAYSRKDVSHNLFYFLDFKKLSKCKPLSKLPTIGLHPCLYKKR